MSRRIAALCAGRPVAGRPAGLPRAVGADRGGLRAAGRPRVADPPDVEVAVLLDLLDAACRSGCGVPAALDAVGTAVGGSMGAALRGVAASLVLGAPWTEAWPDVPALAPVSDALSPSWTQGVAPGDALRAVAATLRRERRARALEEAGRLGVRLVVPLAVCHLPAFVLVGLVPVLLSLAGLR